MRDMLGREELISVEKALELLLKSTPFKTPVEINLPIEEAYGMILSRDAISPEDLPGFSRSTVDGFAVNASDTFGATETLPSYLTVKAEILMGEETNYRIEKGEVAKIATGGMLPGGTDAVVMLEHTQQIELDITQKHVLVGDFRRVVFRVPGDVAAAATDGVVTLGFAIGHGHR